MRNSKLLASFVCFIAVNFLIAWQPVWASSCVNVFEQESMVPISESRPSLRDQFARWYLTARGRSSSVRFFDGEVEAEPIFERGTSYTIIARPDRLVVGKNIRGVDDFAENGEGPIGGKRSHVRLSLLDRPEAGGRPSDFTNNAGSIRINVDGSIDISGYHRTRTSLTAAKRIRNHIVLLFPNTRIRITGGRLSEFPVDN